MNKKNFTFLLTVLVLMVGTSSCSNIFEQTPSEDGSPFSGALPADPAMYAALPHYTPANGAVIGGVIPQYINLSPLCGRVRNQYKLKSCTAEAVATLKTFQEGIDQKWGVNDLSHQFSASFIYNLCNSGQNEGISYSTALSLLLSKGCATNKGMPDDKTSYTTQPNSDAFAEAEEFKIAAVETVDFNQATLIEDALAEGQPVLATVKAYPEIYTLDFGNYVYKPQTSLSRYKRHAIVITGFDHEASRIRFRNSWGEEWGMDGDGFIEYQDIPSLLLEAYVVRDIAHSAALIKPERVYYESFDQASLESWIVDTRHTTNDSWSIRPGMLEQSSTRTSDYSRGMDGFTSRKASEAKTVRIAAGAKKLVAICEAVTHNAKSDPLISFCLNFWGTRQGCLWVQTRDCSRKGEACRKILGLAYDGRTISTYDVPGGYALGTPIEASESVQCGAGAKLALELELNFQLSTCSAWITYSDGSRHEVAVNIDLPGLSDCAGSDLVIQPSLGCLDTKVSFDSISIKQY